MIPPIAHAQAAESLKNETLRLYMPATLVMSVASPLLPTMPRGVTSHCSEIAVRFGYGLRGP